MVRKKTSEEKYPRVTITISPELQSAVMARVRDEGLTLSGVISELLTGWLNGSGELVEPAQPQNHQSNLEQRIEALEQSIQTLIQIDTNRYEEARKVDTNQYALIHTDKIPEQMEKRTVLVCVTEPEKTKDTNQYALVYTDRPGERIILTEDMMKKIHERITAMQATGLNIHAMADRAGIPEGSFKRLTPGHSKPLKTLTREQYERLTKTP